MNRRLAVLAIVLAVAGVLALWDRGEVATTPPSPKPPVDEPPPAARVPRPKPPLAAELPPRAVRVTVKGMDGTPIPRARVELVRGPEVDRTDRWAVPSATAPRSGATEVTGDDGRTELSDTAAGRWFVVGEAPGYARHVVAGVTRTADAGVETDVFLDKAETFTGTIRDADGAPAAGIPVVLENWWGAATWSPDVDSLRTTTGTDGAYRFDAVEPGHHKLWYAPHEGLLVLADGVIVPSLDGLDVRMVRGASIEGVVKDADSGTPVAGARVVATEYETARFSHGGGPTRILDAGASDREGRFALHTWKRRWELTKLLVDAPGYAPVPVDGSSEMPPGPLADGQRFAFELHVRRGASIHGRVTGPDGPLAGFLVRVSPEQDGARPIPDGDASQCVTSANGSFRLDGLAHGDAAITVAEPSSGWPLVSDLKVELTSARDLEHDIRLDLKRVPVVRWAFDSEERPIAGLEVTQSLGALRMSARTDADGRAAFDVWCTSEWPARVLLRCPGFAETVTLISAAEPEDRFGGIRRGEALTGVVAGRDGTPVAGVRVLIAGGVEGMHGDGVASWEAVHEAVTAADGAFRLPVTSGPDHWISMPASDRFDVAGGFDEDEPEKSPVYEFDDVVCIRGEVVVDGKPVAGALIRDGIAAVARTGADGRFAFEYPSRFHEPFELDAYGWSFLPVRAVPEAQRIELSKRTLRIAGVARDEDGAPARGLRVMARARGGREFRAENLLPASATDADGWFVFPELDEGAYDFEIRDAQHALAARPLRTDAGNEKVELVLVPAARLVVHVANPDGEPIGNALVTAIAEGTASDWARSDDEGNATLGVLPETTYTLRVERYQFETKEQPGARPGGEPVTVVLAPRPRTR